jgi:hypothetical protein
MARRRHTPELLVAGLDGEVDPGQIRGLRAAGIRDGGRGLRLPGGSAYRAEMLSAASRRTCSATPGRTHLAAGGSCSRSRHAGGPLLRGVLNRRVAQHIVVDITGQRSYAGQRPAAPRRLPGSPTSPMAARTPGFLVRRGY